LAFFCGTAAYDTQAPVSYVMAAHWSSNLQASMHCGKVNRANCSRIACLAAGLAAYPVSSSKLTSPLPSHLSDTAGFEQTTTNTTSNSATDRWANRRGCGCMTISVVAAIALPALMGVKTRKNSLETNWSDAVGEIVVIRVNNIIIYLKTILFCAHCFRTWILNYLICRIVVSCIFWSDAMGTTLRAACSRGAEVATSVPRRAE